MSIDLLALVTGSQPNDDRETAVAWFQTRTPWIGPDAYLHIVYKPAPPALLAEAAKRWQFPGALSEFLQIQNGAILFAGSLSVYGLLPPGRLLGRRDPFALPPFNIERENEIWRGDRERLLVVGGYRLDGSRVCIDRYNCRVSVFRKGKSTASVTWPSLEAWIVGEISRIGMLFDHAGKLVGEQSETGPPTLMRSDS